MKPAPKYWWDFDKDNIIIVQSDYPGGGRLCECATIEEANKIVDNYESGRKNHPKWNKAK